MYELEVRLTMNGLLGLLDCLRGTSETRKRAHRVVETYNQEAFTDAATAGDLGIIKLAIAVQPKLMHTQNSCGRTAMMSAAKCGHLNVVEFLASKGGSLGYDFRHQTAYLLAVRHGHVDVVKWLYSRYIIVRDDRNSDGRTALHLAAHGGHLQMVRFVLSTNEMLLPSRDIYGQTALMLACANGNSSIVAFLLHKNAVVDMQDYCLQTSLMIAVSAGNLAVVRCLLSARTSMLDGKDRFGRTAFMLAAKNGQFATMTTLYDHGAVVNEVDEHGKNALLMAVGAADFASVRWLVAHGENLQQIDHRGWDAVMFAADTGSLSLVKWLLCSMNMKTTRRDVRGRSAFLLAASNGHTEVAQWLSTRPDVYTAETDTRGRTALMLAVANDYRVATPLVKWLIQSKGLNPSTLDFDGVSTWKRLNWPDGCNFGGKRSSNPDRLGRCLLLLSIPPVVQSCGPEPPNRSIKFIRARVLRSAYLKLLRELPRRVHEETKLGGDLSTIISVYAEPSTDEVWMWYLMDHYNCSPYHKKHRRAKLCTPQYFSSM